MPIRSFRSASTEQLFQAILSGQPSPHVRELPSEIRRVAARKLFQLHTVTRLEDLRVPPGNRLERLAGDRAGQHSLRINDQWRICFKWQDGCAFDVEIVDYH